MLLDEGLFASGDQANVRQTCSTHFFDNVLHYWPSSNRQQFLGQDFRDRQQARAQAAHGDHCLLYVLNAVHVRLPFYA